MNLNGWPPQGVNMNVQNSVEQSVTVEDENCVRHLVPRTHRVAHVHELPLRSSFHITCLPQCVTCTRQVGRSKKDMMLLRTGDMQWTPGCSRKGQQSRNKTNRNSTCIEQKSRPLHCKAGLRMNRSSWNCRQLCRFSCMLEAARSSTPTLMPSSPLKQGTRFRCQSVRCFQRA